MSTRCTVEFVAGDESVKVYKHHDGYPENIIPLLVDFHDVLKKLYATRDYAYTGAQWVWFLKADKMRQMVREANTSRENGRDPIHNVTGDTLHDLDFSNAEDPHDAALLDVGILPASVTQSDAAYRYRVDVSRSQWTITVNPDRDGWSETYLVGRWRTIAEQDKLDQLPFKDDEVPEPK